MRARLVSICVVLVLSPWTFGQETAPIRVPVRLVSVPALVFSSGNRLVPDLQASNFTVLDNGRAQSIRLETDSAPLSIAVVVQATQDVRQYLPFIARAGNVIEALLAGASGEAAVVSYGDHVSVMKPFGSGDVASAFRSVSPSGKPARMIDAGLRAVALLSERPASRSRVLLFIGQPFDSGSESKLESLRRQIEKENVRVFALTLPLLGRAFVSDTFWLQGVSRGEKGGFRTGTDLGNLVAVLNRKADAAADKDPWTTLTGASGGAQLRVRTQRQLEDGIAAIGFQLRSAYLLTYYPSPAETGYHSIAVQVDVPGAKVYSRAGYWLGPE